MVHKRGENRRIEEALTRGVERIYPSKEALKKVLLSGKKLQVYQGFDPSMPSLHLGHLVGLLKLRQFQELGHEVIFLVGDFTGMIGDPSDKSTTRPRLTREQVLENSRNWKEQVVRFLKFSGKNPARILFNSKWLDKITFKDLIEITSNFTVQQMIERDFFQRRLKQKKPIYLHEFLYPVAQALDSVEMDVDLEIGGSDQTFNMLMGRTLMKALKGKEKFVLTMKLLVDKEGRKVGKTTGNAIFLNTPSFDLYGRVMSFPDEVIILGFELLTQVPVQMIKEYKKELKGGKINPMTLKEILAFEITKMNYNKKIAEKAQKEFRRVFQRRKFPSQIKEFKTKKKSVGLCDLLIAAKLAPSKSEAKRLILQKAVKIDREIQEDWRKIINLKKGMIIRVGKRKFVKII